MKTHVTALAALAIACMIPPVHCFAKATRDDAVSLPVRLAKRQVWEVTVGSTEGELLSRFRAPAYKLTDQIWVYERQVSSDERAQELNCDTLLVTVADGRVIEMRLVNKRALEVIASHVRSNPPTLLAAE